VTAVLAQRKSLEPWLRDDVEYYSHQIEGIRTLARMRSFLLADDMGLGKSLQALTVFCMDIKMGLGETLLIVCPVTLRANWAEEIEKFTRLPYELLGEEPDPIHRGKFKKITPKKREAQLQAFLGGSGPRILIANYEQMASAAHDSTLANATFSAICFDEAHYIKNHASGRTKAAIRLRSTRSFMLTGTPMLNNADELWPLLHRIDPIRFPKYWTFVARFCVRGGYKDKQIIGTKNQSELIGILSEVMVRRVKRDVLTLPEPFYIPVKVTLNEFQQELYDKAKNELLVGDQELDNPLTLFLRLKQICNTPYSIDRSFPDESEKLDRMTDIAQEVIINNEKLVIFTQFRGTLECIVRRLQERMPNLPLFQLHGDVPSRDRVPTVQAWSKIIGPAVICCMTQVAGIGLNMTAASTCIFVDKLFVPGLNKQAVDRLHRIGASETQAVRVFELIARGTCEDRVEQILRGKAKLFDEIVEGSVTMQALLKELMKAEAEDDMP
jgi:SNF2 family DNA or RNA helicase